MLSWFMLGGFSAKVLGSVRIGSVRIGSVYGKGREPRSVVQAQLVWEFHQRSMGVGWVFVIFKRFIIPSCSAIHTKSQKL